MRDFEGTDATLCMDDPEGGRPREYHDRGAVRKAKELAAAGISVAVDVVKAGPGPWDRKVLNTGFLKKDGEKFVIESEVAGDVPFKA